MSTSRGGFAHGFGQSFGHGDDHVEITRIEVFQGFGRHALRRDAQGGKQNEVKRWNNTVKTVEANKLGRKMRHEANSRATCVGLLSRINLMPTQAIMGRMSTSRGGFKAHGFGQSFGHLYGRYITERHTRRFRHIRTGPSCNPQADDAI